MCGLAKVFNLRINISWQSHKKNEIYCILFVVYKSTP